MSRSNEICADIALRGIVPNDARAKPALAVQKRMSNFVIFIRRKMMFHKGRQLENAKRLGAQAARLLILPMINLVLNEFVL